MLERALTLISMVVNLMLNVKAIEGVFNQVDLIRDSDKFALLLGEAQVCLPYV